MSSKRFLAIILIFFVASAAWVSLGRTLQYRTDTLEDSLSKQLNALWGPTDLVQTAPYVSLSSASRKSENFAEPLQSNVSIHFEHHNRYKGLLWFSTYTADFLGQYLVQAPSDGGDFVFALPARADFFENFQVVLDNQPVDVTYPSTRARSGNQLVVDLPADGQAHQITISYTTRGQDSWQYALAHSAATQIQVKNFTLKATTNFRDIDYPEGSKSPNSPAKSTAKGMEAVWKLNNVWINQQIGIEMPARRNAGPIAARMSFFAPVSLLFFFTVLFTIVLLKKIPLHPMHYMFIAAGFFAFHILLAYLVDVIDIHAAFWICAVVSVFLVISYMRLVVGVKFAVIHVGLAQLIYLVGFSYAFFTPDHTGRAIVIGAIITLFVLMQATGRIDWHEFFKSPPIPTAHLDRSPRPPEPPT